MRICNTRDMTDALRTKKGTVNALLVWLFSIVTEILFLYGVRYEASIGTTANCNQFVCQEGKRRQILNVFVCRCTNLKLIVTMENCEYTEVFTDAGIGLHTYDKKTWKPLLRQTIISLAVCCPYFLLGVFIGAPTTIVAQTRRDVNSTEIITDEMLSWLTSTSVISSVPFVIIMPLLFNQIGRKLTIVIAWLFIFIAFIIFYTSKSLYHIVISEVFAGASSASLVTIGPVVIAEYTSPRYRGIFLTLKSASIFWGIWVSNAIGTFYPWKNIAITCFVCSIYMISITIWPESPYWLARKGRYVESAKSHRWLKGVNEISEKELARLIISQKTISTLPSPSGRINDFCFLVRNICLTITKRPFYKPVLISLTLFAQDQCTGKVIISLYAIDVLKHLTQDESFVYKGMLILDGVTVFSMYIGCILSRYFKRRTLLLLFSSSGISLLYILSLYSYLVSLSVLRENHVIILLLLSAFSVTVSCGPIILPMSIYGEIVPTRYQKLGMICIGLGATIITSLLLKFSPFMFTNLKLHGCFLFFAMTSSIFLCIIYIYLPETKDKTLQEIEEYFTKTQPPLETNTSLLKQTS